jgi:RNA polymerase sigma-70 factor (ECF subfamily)
MTATHDRSAGPQKESRAPIELSGPPEHLVDMQSRAGELAPADPSDADLVEAALAGDVAGLGLVLERHRAGLFASALAQLGSREQAADAVQETFVVALVKLRQLRDPATVVGWLHAILRNLCRAAVRRDAAERAGLARLAGAVPAEEASPEQAVEDGLLKDWVWTALGRLPEPLQVAAVLRYFSRSHSYQEIADLCGVPVGTVRSRLHEARSRLGSELLETAGRAALAAGSPAATWPARVVEAVDAIGRGDPHPYTALLAPDVVLSGSDGQFFGGRDEVLRELEHDLTAGVGYRLTGVFASRLVTVVETDFVNPPDSPDHCPPGLTTVLLHSGTDQARRARGYFSSRPALTGAPEGTR